MLIAFEGVPGAGKTTQALLLVERLRGDGLPVAYLPDLLTLQVDELGATLFSLFASSRDPFMRHADVVTDVYLAAAIRANIVAMVIEPALSTGQIVIEDRGIHTMYSYSLASVLAGHRMPPETAVAWLQAIGALVDREADLAVRLTMALPVAHQRFTERSGTPWTAEQRSYLHHVDQAYLELQGRTAWLVDIAADELSAEQVHESVYQAVIERMRRVPRPARHTFA